MRLGRWTTPAVLIACLLAVSIPACPRAGKIPSDTAELHIAREKARQILASLDSTTRNALASIDPDILAEEAQAMSGTRHDDVLWLGKQAARVATKSFGQATARGLVEELLHAFDPTTERMRTSRGGACVFPQLPGSGCDVTGLLDMVVLAVVNAYAADGEQWFWKFGGGRHDLGTLKVGPFACGAWGEHVELWVSEGYLSGLSVRNIELHPPARMPCADELQCEAEAGVELTLALGPVGVGVKGRAGCGIGAEIAVNASLASVEISANLTVGFNEQALTWISHSVGFTRVGALHIPGFSAIIGNIDFGLLMGRAVGLLHLRLYPDVGVLNHQLSKVMGSVGNIRARLPERLARRLHAVLLSQLKLWGRSGSRSVFSAKESQAMCVLACTERI